jgi:hypothetical protein
VSTSEVAGASAGADVTSTGDDVLVDVVICRLLPYSSVDWVVALLDQCSRQQHAVAGCNTGDAGVLPS